MPRPRQLPPRKPLAEDEILTAAYVGSGEHKTKRWWGGLPDAFVGTSGVASRPGKQLTTICPLTTNSQQAMATQWVQAALREGKVRFYEGDKLFPKHIWYRDADQLWFGFCVNSVQGEYKGWPIEEDERREIFG